MTIWQRWELPRQEGMRLHTLGKLQLYVAVDMTGEGELLATLPVYSDSTAKSTATTKRQKMPSLPPLSDKAWTRFYTGSNDSYALAPAYPPLPICVRLNQPFSLAPGSDLEGWVFSRLDARIAVGDTTVVSYPTDAARKTLYGPPDTGVVCRFDTADFLAAEEPIVSSLHADPRYVAHPVRIRNTSTGSVRVTDLCIYGEQLSIFLADSMLLSERLLFSFSSSGVRMSLDGQSPLTRNAQAIAKPTVSGEERFIVRSFELFKTMTRI